MAPSSAEMFQTSSCIKKFTLILHPGSGLNNVGLNETEQ